MKTVFFFSAQRSSGGNDGSQRFIGRAEHENLDPEKDVQRERQGRHVRGKQQSKVRWNISRACA